MLRLLSCTFFLLNVGGAFAKANAKEDVKPVSLKEVIQKGIENSPVLKKSHAAWKEAQNLVSKSESLLLPNISANAIARTRQDPSILRQSGVAAFSAREEYNAQLIMSQPLYTGGALLNGIGKFRADEEIARQKYLASKQDVILDLISTYFDLAQKESLYLVAKEQTEILANHAKITARHETIGRARTMDRLQAAVNLTVSEGEVAKLDGERVVAANNLRRLLGVEISREPWGAPFPFTITPIAPLKRDEAYRLAEQNNPEFQAQVLARSQQEYSNALDWVEDLPSLRLEGALGYRSFDRPSWFDESSRYYFVGVNFTVPIFSGLSTLAKRRVHAESLNRVDQEIHEMRLKIQSELDEALQSVELTASRLEDSQRAAKQARQALSLANTGYQRGVATHQDVLTAQNTRYNSEKLLIETQYNYLKSLATLRKLMGVNMEQTYAKQ